MRGFTVLCLLNIKVIPFNRYKFICYPLVSSVACNKENVEKVLDECGVTDYEIGSSKVSIR